MTITVYLGANEGNDPGLRETVAAVGRFIGENGHSLVYGGSKSGLMGVLAENVVESGGEAVGVEPVFFIDMVEQYDGLKELIVTKDMAERKGIMVDKGDAFLAMPGGTGTLEEIAEIMSKVCLDHLDAPCILYNYKGYYNGLKQLFANMVEYGLSTEELLSDITFVESIEELKGALS